MAQTPESPAIVFGPVFGDSKLQELTYYKINDIDSVQFTALKFYISGVELIHQYKTVWKEANSYHLVDAFQEQSLSLPLNVPTKLKYDRIKFNIGIDSTTSVSGAMGGDLDPTKGMYWAWQSGYINFKVEGKSNLCKTRNTEFQYHLGGYRFPYNNLQSIFMDMPASQLHVVLDLKKLITEMPLTQKHHIMSPGNEAMLMMERVINCLSIKK
ncbi:MAG: hypothetical protein K0S53_532 [Bacteroidetes bacterium]|nr:hypothetical protein [Bacteroidota bacterium]